MFTILPPGYVLSTYTVIYSQTATVRESLVINLSNGELGQAQFLERDQGHVMEKVVRGWELKREIEGDRNGEMKMRKEGEQDMTGRESLGF